VIKRYHAPEPPVRRALLHAAVSEADKSRLQAMLAEADPVLLLAEIRAAQEELGQRVGERAWRPVVRRRRLRWIWPGSRRA
jgi:transposase